MNVLILDAYGQRTYASWSKGEFNGLTYLLQRIGGMISASFNVPIEYAEPYKWARFYNQVELYHESVPVFSGYIHDLSRYWSESESGIKVDLAGWVAKLAKDYVTTDLSNEKASTYITDHILVGELANWVGAGEIDTGDYTIPDIRDYIPQKTKRQVMDDLISFNLDTHDWGVWGKELYWKRRETQVAYRTNTANSVGSLRQGIGESGSVVKGAYRDLLGVWTIVTATDATSEDPTEYILETYSDNMTAAQATQLAEQSLERVKLKGANADITVQKIWTKEHTPLDPREIRPGMVIEIGSMVPGQASIAEADVDNDMDTFAIESVKVNDETGFAQVSPGKLPYDLQVMLAGGN